MAALNHESAEEVSAVRWLGTQLDRRSRCRLGYGQPGGWAYSCMMFMEASTNLQLSSGLPYSNATPNKFAMNYTVASGANCVQPNFMCPSRRATQAYPLSAGYQGGNQFTNATISGPVTRTAAKGDYAASMGGPRLHYRREPRWRAEQLDDDVHGGRTHHAEHDHLDCLAGGQACHT